ncbi:MAG: serine/threonine-protein kinase, partial [Vicinamibacteria bacterium]|nr:serine/threonine-protein kinase [Vicinamibacteria bacterium]
MPGMVKLRVVVGPLLGRVFEFTAPDVFLFGRAPECHARLAEEDVKVSRHHFVLEVRPPRAVLRDLGSLNGTWVNDRKYGGRERQRAPQPDVPKPNPEVEIHAGDKIRVGATVFEVSIEGGSECAACRCGLDLGQSKIYQVMNGRLLCESCARREGTGPVISVRSPLAAEQPSSAVPVPPLEEDFDMSSGAAAAREKRGEDAQLPRAIGNYDIERQVGKGGMGVVYLARRRRDGRAVALKVMSSQMADHDARSVFEREVEVTRALKH